VPTTAAIAQPREESKRQSPEDGDHALIRRSPGRFFPCAESSSSPAFPWPRIFPAPRRGQTGAATVAHSHRALQPPSVAPANSKPASPADTSTTSWPWAAPGTQDGCSGSGPRSVRRAHAHCPRAHRRRSRCRSQNACVPRQPPSRQRHPPADPPGRSDGQIERLPRRTSTG
jgi:hypothetical protein